MVLKEFGWVTLIVAGIAAAQARADFVAFTIDDLATGTTLGSPPYTLGFEFTVVAPISVTQLGVFDDSQDGLVGSYPVGLFDAGGNLLVSTTVSSGAVDPLTDQFRYTAIAPFALGIGDYFVGALYVTGDDGIVVPPFATNFQASPSITFLQNGFIPGGVLAARTLNSSGSTPGFFGPNFKYTTSSAVPEPGSLTLLGLGLASFGGIAWTKKRRNATAKTA